MSLIEVGAGLGDDGGDAALRLLGAHLLGHEFADDGDLVALGRGELRAVAGVVGGDRILALLDHLGEQRKDLVVAQKLAAGLGAGGDVAVLQRGVDQPERAESASASFAFIASFTASLNCSRRPIASLRV